MVFGALAALGSGFGGFGNIADPRLAELRRNLAGQMSKFGGSECALIKKGAICNEAVRGEPVS